MDELDRALTPSPKPRLALATLAVAVPVIVGAVATLVQWRGPVAAASPATYATAPPVATLPPQVLLHDGAAVIPWPLTSGPIDVKVGQKLEIVLHSLPGEQVLALNPVALAFQPSPPCQLTTVCGTNVNRYTVLARIPGTFYLLVDYGRRCRPSVCLNEPTQLTVVVTR